MDVTDLQEQLAQRAFLHDDPDAYLAGVRDALGVLTDQQLRTVESEDAQHLRGA